MTPKTHRLIWADPGPLLPEGLDVSADRLGFRDLRPAGPDHPGTDGLLESFVALASADPADMGEFVLAYGIPELCAHGRPHFHPGRPAEAGHGCPWIEANGVPGVGVDAIRATARAFGAAADVAVDLAARRAGDPRAWSVMGQVRGPGFYVPREVEWVEGRRRLSEWLTGLLRDCGVAPLVRWDYGGALQVTHEAPGLVGVLAVLLAREIGQGEAYACDVCGESVARVRPPLDGERVYCRKPACRRAQQARNRAASRARKRAEAGNDG